MECYIIAGENSGDFIGQRLICALEEESRERGVSLKISGVGGRKMNKAGVTSLFDIAKINLMGFIEIIPSIFQIKKLIDKTVQDILLKKPKILITIDSPGFTFRVAKKIRKLAPEIILVHIVAPSVWAYKPSRAKKYAQIYDHMLTLLPFEPSYFTKEGMSATCIGHPALEQNFCADPSALRSKVDIDQDIKIVSVTAGSRKGEIIRHMPVIRKAFDELSKKHKIKVIFVQEDESNVEIVSDFLEEAEFDYIFSRKNLKSFAISDCVLAKSGTNTLEVAASKAPMVVGYKMNGMTFSILKMIVKIKYASLINIIANREIIPEYLQSEFTAENIESAISDILSDDKKSSAQVVESMKILQSIGLGSKKKPSEIAAKIILDIIK